MVFIRDFKKEFYDVVQHQRVLVLVSFDVDALCACKIIQYLFQCDHILYTIVAVSGKLGLEEAFRENAEGIQYVLLINCGATLNVVDFLQPRDEMVFFICDSHRPVDVFNVYNQVQVKMLMKEADCDGIPPFDDVFRSDDDETLQAEDNDSLDDGSDEESENVPKRRRFDAQTLEKKRELRIWNEQRDKILFEYSEFASYGTSVSLLLHEIAWKLSKDTNDLLWLAIVGVTDQFIEQRIDRDRYIDSISQLQPHVSRLNHRPDDAETLLSVDCLRIAFSQELQLVLYRHWTLYDSLCHTEYTACKFSIWTANGRKRLREFLASMGLPYVQCTQKFVSMDTTYRDEIKDMITKYSGKFGLVDLCEHDLFLPSFHAQYGYRNKLCASDVVRSCQGLLESMEPGNSSTDNFLKALDVLNRSKTSEMTAGLELAKLHLKTIFSQVQTFLDMHQVVSAGPFLYAFVQESGPDARLFSRPICLCRLARFTLEAYCVAARNKKAKSLPLVVGSHLSSENGAMLVVGIAPVSDKSTKNCFGKAFEQAAKISNSGAVVDSFDSHFVELKLEDRSKFFDALITLLQ